MLIKNAADLKKLDSIADSIGQTSKMFLYIYLIINILFGFALGMLWGAF